MSDTPRTDKEAVGFACLLVDRDIFKVTEIIPADFARELERELGQVRRQLRKFQEISVTVDERYENRIDELEHEIAVLKTKQQEVRYEKIYPST